VAGVNLLLIARDAKGELLAVHERYGDVKLDRAGHEDFASKLFKLGIPLTQPTTTCRFRVWRTIRERSRSSRIDFRPKRSAGPIW
jgi:hypothetical protein